MAVSHQHSMAMEKTNVDLGGIRLNTSNRHKEVLVTLSKTTAFSHLEFCIQFWPLLTNKYIKHLILYSCLVEEGNSNEMQDIKRDSTLPHDIV